jgi:two-component system nitrate/nitrite sensor histidine kinase NarX
VAPDVVALLTWLRWIAILLPVGGITLVHLIRLVLAPEPLPYVALDIVVGVITVAFGLTVFAVLGRSYRLLLRQIDDLRLRHRRSDAFSRILWQITEQEALPVILSAVSRHAVDLLDGVDGGMCLSVPRGSAGLGHPSLRPGAAGLVCVSADPGMTGPGNEAACAVLCRDPALDVVSVQVKSMAGTSGRIWVTRRQPGGREERELLGDLAGLTSLALDRAHVLEDERRDAAAAERDRIARELHDSLAQVLGVIHLRLSALRVTRDIPAAAGTELGELTEICHDAYLDVREAILGLREAGRADHTLLESLDVYLQKFSRQSGVAARLVTDLDGGLDLTPPQEVQVIRVLQEALTNVRKHSGATTVTIRVDDPGDEIVFTVEDDGVGFDPENHAVNGDHYGLATMRERIESLGGRLAVDSAPGRGARVIATLPRLVSRAVPAGVPW